MKYFANRLLGLALITAYRPGFGKTTAVSVITLALSHSVGRILASQRAFKCGHHQLRCLPLRHREPDCRSVQQGQTRVRRKLIVHAHALKDEISAFQTFLKSPSEGDNEAPNHRWRPDSKWHAYLSPARYLLGILRSIAGHQIELNDNTALAQLQSGLDANPDLQKLRDVVPRCGCRHGWMMLELGMASGTGWRSPETASTSGTAKVK